MVSTEMNSRMDFSEANLIFKVHQPRKELRDEK